MNNKVKIKLDKKSTDIVGLNRSEFSGGMIVILIDKEKNKFLLLPQRTKGAETNPGQISGFFGNVENIKKIDSEIERECNEELFLFDETSRIIFGLEDYDKMEFE